MYDIVAKEFDVYDGSKITFAFRDDTNDENTILSIVRDDEYLTAKMTYKPGDVFVDIGAHLGGWSKLMEHLVPDAQVIAVEPLPENLALLKANTHAKLYGQAISHQAGVMTKVYYADDSKEGQHHRFVGNIDDLKGKKFIEVETINLNTLLAGVDHVRVLKMDCEGGEHSALRSINNKTLEKIDYMIGEYHNPAKMDSRTKHSLFMKTRGLFEDISETKEDTTLGAFWFRNKRLND